MTPVISARGLSKRYGEVKALDGLDLAVEAGQVLALLGPNGAGKTTAVSILSTLLIPDAGTATVAGADVISQPELVRQRIGLSGQYAAVDEHLTGYENLRMVGRLYQMPKGPARRRARELLDTFDLGEAADRPVRTYSGGMRRRLDLAAALVARPPVLFLDEPTTALDPRGRTDLWNVIRALVVDGTTVLLTTQYLEEVDRQADHVVVIDHGRSIADGTPSQLKRTVGGERIVVTVTDHEHVGPTRDVLMSVAAGAIHIDSRTRTLTAPIEMGRGSLNRTLHELDDRDIEVVEVGIRRPTLDDVFLKLTGRVAEYDEPGVEGGAGV